jgi:hypothetical protein
MRGSISTSLITVKIYILPLNNFRNLGEINYEGI